LFYVSTIHSFLWKLIENHQTDIREWVKNSIQSDIIGLEEKQRKGRAGKAADKRTEDIKRKDRTS